MVSANAELPTFIMEEPTPVRVTCQVCFTSNDLGKDCIRCQQNEEYKQSLLAENVVDLNEVRAHRVAYLMGNRIRDANEAADCEINNVDSNTNSNEVVAGTLQLQEIPGTQCEEFKDLKVHRSFVEKDMLQHFRDSSCMSAQLTFTILNDKGDAEMGAGAGVTREVFTLFWKQFANYMTVGERERVPFIQHGHFIDEWEAVARILVKGYEMVSYFPTYLSKAFLSFCLF